jgi:hypothetical protein
VSDSDSDGETTGKSSASSEERAMLNSVVEYFCAERLAEREVSGSPSPAREDIQAS